jgi:putative transposase
LKQIEAGRKTEDVAREHGVSKHTVYALRAKYGGSEVNKAGSGHPEVLEDNKHRITPVTRQEDADRSKLYRR